MFNCPRTVSLAFVSSPVSICLCYLSVATGNWCCDFCDDTSALAGFGRGNGESVAALLACFFYYWAHQHDFRRGVVTVRQSSAMTKAMKGW